MPARGSHHTTKMSLASARNLFHPKRKHHHHKKRIPLAIIAGLAPTAVYGFQGFQQQGPIEGLARVSARLTGYSPTENKFKYDELVKGWFPLLLGYVGHKIAGKLGINRMIASTGIPFIEI